MKGNLSTAVYKTKLEKLRKAYTEKIVLFLSNKYTKVFKDKGYTNTMLTNDINKMLTEKEINNFDFGRDIKKYEKNVLSKVSKIQKTNYVPLEMNKINKLLPKNNNENIQNDNIIINNKEKEIGNENEKNIILKEKIIPPQIKNNIFNNNNINSNENKEEVPYSTERMERLKKKENDKWAIQAKLEHEKYLKEEKEQREKILEQKKKQKEYLEQQIKEKQEREKNKRKEEQEYYNKNNDFFGNDFNNRNKKNYTQNIEIKNNENIDKKEIEKEKKIQNFKKNQLENENEKYKKQLQDELKQYQEEEKIKKQKLKEKYIQMEKENKALMEQKKLLMQKEKENNMNNNNTNFLHFESNHQFNYKNNNINNGSESQKYSQRIRNYEEQKLQREMEEREKKEEMEILLKKQQKEKMIMNYRKELNEQLSEKKKRIY